MDARWVQIMNGISYQKPESIDKKSLLITLRLDKTYDEQVLDSLYSLKIIDICEYIELMERLVKINEDVIEWMNKKIKDAKERQEKYDPMTYYGLGFDYTEIINKNLNEKWTKSQG